MEEIFSENSLIMGKYKRIDFCKGVFEDFFKREKEKALDDGWIHKNNG